MATLTIDIGVKLRKYQAEVTKFLKRFNVLCWHRRAGKSFWAAWYIVRSLLIMLRDNKHDNLQFAYIAPTKEQARRIIWDYLKLFTSKLPDVHYDEQKLIVTIRLPGRTPAKIFLLGVENFESIRGMYFDGVVCDEYSEWDPRAWRTVIRATIIDRKGWVIFIGTSKGPNHFAELFENSEGKEGWYTKKFDVDQTLAIDPVELEMMKLDLTPEEYAQEMMCSFIGSSEQFYYAHILDRMSQNNQIAVVPAIPMIETYTFWDLGISDYMAIWFVQKVGTEIRIVEYEEWVGKGMPQVAKILKQKDYLYGKHILPHDGGHREIGTGITRQEKLEELMGVGTVEVLPRTPVADGIDHVRAILPLCLFNLTTTKDGLKALKKYQKEFDHKNNVFKNNPLHNWSSHGSDAFRTFAMGAHILDYSIRRKANRNRPTQANIDDHNIFGYSIRK